jgi:hypothetical protein
MSIADEALRDHLNTASRQLRDVPVRLRHMGPFKVSSKKRIINTDDFKFQAIRRCAIAGGYFPTKTIVP